MENQKFDRKNLRISETFLRHLRARGWARLCQMSPSKNLEYLLPAMVQKRGGIFVDCGCGDSADAVIATKYGYSSYAFDLFEPDKEKSFNHRDKNVNYVIPFEIYQKTKNLYFILQDICENWKLPQKADFISSYAMITLLNFEDRILFYQQAYKNLKRKGILIIHYPWLVSGYGLEPTDLIKKNVERIGFKVLFETNLQIVLIKSR